MTEEEYRAAIAEYKSDRLEHGGKWKDHKYIRIENGRYIYPDEKGKKLNAKLAEQNDKYLATDNTKFREMHNAVSKEKITDKNSYEMDKKIDKKLDAALGEKVTKAAKEVVDEIVSDRVRTIKYFLKGFMSEDDDLWEGLSDSIEHHFRAKKIDPDKVDLDDYVDGDEMESLIYKRVIKEATDIVNGSDTSDYDPKRLAMLKEELNDESMKSRFDRDYKTNRPFASKESEDETARKKVKHGFDSRDDFYAAVYDYKKAHKVDHRR